MLFCPSLREPKTGCTWSGKRGHTEEACRAKAKYSRAAVADTRQEEGPPPAYLATAAEPEAWAIQPPARGYLTALMSPAHATSELWRTRPAKSPVSAPSTSAPMQQGSRANSQWGELIGAY